MPRLTPDEYTRACALGIDPDKITLKQLGIVRGHEEPPPEGERTVGYEAKQPFLLFKFKDAAPPPQRTVAPWYPNDLPIQERFEMFHERNPHVYTRLRYLALQLRRRGHLHYGIKALIEVLRWDHAMRTTNEEPLKLNNAFATPYAYRLMDNEPELEGFFKTRQRKKETRNDNEAPKNQ